MILDKHQWKTHTERIPLYKQMYQMKRDMYLQETERFFQDLKLGKSISYRQISCSFLKYVFCNSCLQSCGNIPEGNPVPWQEDCFDHIDYKSRHKRSQWQKLSFLNVEPNLLTKTSATYMYEIIPTLDFDEM